MKPADIEAESFRIIDREAGPHGFGPEEWQVGRRMIHTPAPRATAATRADAAVDAAAAEMKDGIYVVGNAPTALLRLIERVRLNQVRPALIVGLPAGFVNAAESKAAPAALE